MFWGNAKNLCLADIYSAGIILFVLKSKGIMPHTESKPYKNIDLMYLLYHNNSEFWAKHCEINRVPQDFYEQDFRDLFNSMVQIYADERASLQEIKESKWYNKPVYTQEELMGIMETFLS